jgi:outer membrane lipoprotein-sorting protein
MAHVIRKRIIDSAFQAATAGWLVLAVAALVAFPAGAHAESPLTILKRSVRADGRVSYSAKIEIGIYENGRQTGTRTQKVIKDSGNRRRVESLSDQGGGVIVSDGRTEWEYRPKRKLVKQRELPVLEDAQRWRLQALDAVARTLNPAYEGTATVAGRQCYVIALKPPDGSRTRKRVWVDCVNHTELKANRYGPEGGILGTWTVTEIQFDPDLDPALFQFSPPEGCRVDKLAKVARGPLGTAEQEIGFKAVVPSRLPVGFAFLRDQASVMHMRSGDALWMQFTNGVDSFSTFQTRQKEGRPGNSGRAISWDARGFSLFLVGQPEFRLSSEDLARVKESTQN